MNATSSRSHAVLMLHCEKRPRSSEESKGARKRRVSTTALEAVRMKSLLPRLHSHLHSSATPIAHNSSLRFLQGKLVRSTLCLVDLAGSERVKRSGASGDYKHDV